MIDNIQWSGNSKEMYKFVMNKIPILFKGKVNRLIKGWIIENNVQEITEDTVIEALKDYTPRKFLDEILEEMEKLKSNE